jgi:cell wall-associated NlpC family hydrolase
MLAPWATEYIGLPFQNKGRDREGLDCWGLVRLVLSERFGKRLPSYTGQYQDCCDDLTVSALVDTAIPILKADRLSSPEPGSVVLIRLRGHLCHVGVYVGDGQMLHARDGTGVVLEDLRRGAWKHRVEGYYRV